MSQVSESCKRGERPAMTAMDAHQHYWRYRAAAYRWIAPGSVLACDRLPQDVHGAMIANGIADCIAVQARQDPAETDWLLALAAEHRWIAGVVGWTDLTAADLPDRLDRWQGSRLVGLRHMIQDDPDPDWLARGAARAGVAQVLERGLAYDILVRPGQLAQVPGFLHALPPDRGALILDHGGKPDIKRRGWQPWADDLRAIAAHPGVRCKLSGLVTEADHEHWNADDMRRYLDHLLDCFGPDRLMFGSDWPVCLLAAEYDRVVALIGDFVDAACPAQRAAIFGGTARRCYGVQEQDQDGFGTE